MAVLLNPCCDNCSCVGTVRTFVGGEFTTVGGTARLSIAKLASDGTVIASWSADLADGGGNASIKAMVLDGTTLYVGGNFDTIGGTARECLAALDVNTGAVLSWSADLSAGASDNVDCLLLVGTDLYVGGTFTSLGGSARDNAGVVSTAGVVGAWNPDTNASVLALAHDSGIIYLGGTFSTVSGGTGRNALAAFATDGTLQAWNPGATLTRTVRALAIDSGIVYIGGNFTVLGGSARNALGAVATDGTLQSWNPSVRNAFSASQGNVRTLAVVDGVVYIGGNFDQVSLTTRNNLAAVGTDGTLSSWNPNVTPASSAGSANGVYQLFVRSDNVYAIGVCSAVGGTTRNDAFVIGTDGDLADWNANLAGGNPTGESIIAAE